MLILGGEEGRSVVGGAVGEWAGERKGRRVVGRGDGGGIGGLEGREIWRTGSVRGILVCHRWDLQSQRNDCLTSATGGTRDRGTYRGDGVNVERRRLDQRITLKETTPRSGELAGNSTPL